MNDVTSARPLTEQERLLVSHVIVAARLRDEVQLLAQLSTATVVGGIPTLLELAVPQEAPRAAVNDGPLPSSNAVRGPAGELMGEVIVWIEHGYLSGLEYAWVSDEAPTKLPDVEQVSFLE